VELKLHTFLIWRSVFSYTFQPLYPREENFLCPLDKKLHAIGSQFGHGDKIKNIELAGIRTPVTQRLSWFIQSAYSNMLVTIINVLNHLGYLGN
jgi:hypothetical protein